MADNKNNKKEMVGHGDFQYSVDKEWGIQDPSKIPVNDCHEMVMDSKGRILMTTTGANNNNVLVYDKSGKVLESWGTEFPGAHGLSIMGENSDQFLFQAQSSTRYSSLFSQTIDITVPLNLEMRAGMMIYLKLPELMKPARACRARTMGESWPQPRQSRDGQRGQCDGPSGGVAVTLTPLPIPIVRLGV